MAVFAEMLPLDWMDARGLLIFLVVFLILTDYVMNKCPSDFPPGPWDFPFIGDTYRVQPTKMHQNFIQFANKYGPIFSIRILGGRVVVINGYKLVKDALVKRAEDYTDRPILPTALDIIGSRGLLVASGPAWKQQRRFALYSLRNLGLGKTHLEPTIEQECQHLVEAFAQHQGVPFDARAGLLKASSNIISSLVFGKRFDDTEKKHECIVESFSEILKLQNGRWAMLYNMCPWLFRHLPGPHLKLFELVRNLMSYIDERVEEHRVDHDPALPRDYIDCFLTEMQKECSPDSRFDNENLSVCVLDLFFAGTETTTTTLYWSLLYMCSYPDIQKKVQAELDAVVGTSRPPSISDRDSTPYTYAVIQEIQRMGNILPLNVIRLTTNETPIGKYTIPKGTPVIATLDSVLHDESMWETPHTFNPHHFLDQDGQARKREAFLPFSAGKRVCPGEQLARMELYLFFTILLQRFSFTAPPGETLRHDGSLALTLCPKPFLVCATPR